MHVSIIHEQILVTNEYIRDLNGSKTMSSFCRLELLQPRYCPGFQDCSWFLKIEPVRIICMCVCVCVCVCVCLCVCVCPPPRLLITSGMMWRDIDSIQLVKQVL